MANAWLRIGSCAIVAAVATSIVGTTLPLFWFAGLVPVVLIDRWVFKRLLEACVAHRAPMRIPRLIAWTVLQSVYGNLVAVMLWFSPYVPGETLAIIYLFGGLANAAARLRSSDAKSRVIVLVTDGVNNAGEIDPRSAAAVAKGLGIRVYTVGVGRRGTAPMPVTVRSPFTGREEVRRVDVEVEVDEALLAEISRSTGGRFFRATDAQGLRDTFREIDQLEKTTRETKRYVRYREAFPPFVWAALALGLLPLVASLVGWSLEP